MDVTIEGGRVKNQERRVGFRRGKEGGIDRSKTISSSTLNRSLGYSTSFAVRTNFPFFFHLFWIGLRCSFMRCEKSS